MPSAHISELGILGPGAKGHLVPRLRDVDEARLLDIILLQVQNPKRLAHLLTRSQKDLVPSMEDVAFWHGAVVGDPRNRVFNLLVPGAGLQVTGFSTAVSDRPLRRRMRKDLLIRLFVKGWPIGDAAVQRAGVHVIEAALFERPLRVRVVDLEVAVWRHPLRLCGTEIGADDLSVGELVGEIPGHQGWNYGKAGSGRLTWPRYLCRSPHLVLSKVR